MQKNQGAKITMYRYIQMYTLFCYHLQSCQRFLISSALYYVDQKPLTWKDVLLPVVLIYEWIYECLELVIRYLYRSPFWNILKSTIICYMILLDLFIFQSNMDTAEWKVMVSSVDDFYVVTANKSALTNESHARKLYGW